jgi:hypothetical protein
MSRLCPSPPRALISLLALLVPLVLNSQNDPAAQDALGWLKSLAAEQIHTDPRFLGKTRFRIDGEARTFFYDVSPVRPDLVLSASDPYATPLEALIRVEALRRDFKTAIPGEPFWMPSLDSVEKAVSRCALGIPDCSTGIESNFDVLRKQILDYARSRNLTLAQQDGTRDPVAGYRVQVKIDPPKARVRLMTLLQYRKYQHLQTPREQYQWNDLLDSEADLIGWYHYRAEWPSELNGPEEGDFEIKKPGKLNFNPTSK